MLDKATVEQDEAKRNKMWARDRQAGDGGGSDLPGRLRQGGAAARSKNVTNVFVNESFGYYDYTAMGVKQ